MQSLLFLLIQISLKRGGYYPDPISPLGRQRLPLAYKDRLKLLNTVSVNSAFPIRTMSGLSKRFFTRIIIILHLKGFCRIHSHQQHLWNCSMCSRCNSEKPICALVYKYFPFCVLVWVVLGVFIDFALSRFKFP